MSFRFWVDVYPAIIQPRSAAKVSPQGDEPLPRVTSLAGNAPRARTHQPTDQGGTPFDPYLWGCNKILRTTITKAEEDCPSSTAANIRFSQLFAAFCLSKKAKNALSRRLLCLSAPSFCSFWGACRGDFQIPDLTFCLHAITLPLQVATFGEKCGHFRGRKWPRERQGLCGSIARLSIIPLGHAHGLAETALSLPRTHRKLIDRTYLKKKCAPCEERTLTNIFDESTTRYLRIMHLRPLMTYEPRGNLRRTLLQLSF